MITYTPDYYPSMAFAWEGGPYIDVQYLEPGGCGTFKAVDVINVWDYETDKPRIPVTLDAMRTECDLYYDSQYEDMEERAS